VREALLGVLGLVVALKLLGLVNLYLRVRGMVLRRPRWRVAAPGEVPAWLTDFAAPAVARLTTLGFEPRGALATVGFDRQLDDESHDLLFEHPETRTWAFVYLQPVVPTGRPLFVDLVTWRRDGGAFMTLATQPGVADRALEDVELEPMPHLSLGRRVMHHRFRVESMGVEAARDMTLAGVAEDLSRRHGAMADAAVSRGEITPQADGTLAYTLRGALAVLRNIVGGLGGERVAAFHGSWGPDRLGDPPPPVHQARIHDELLLLTRRRTQRSARLWVFAGTLALFAATLIGRVEPLTLGLLIGVLLLHELGHFVAMRACGYRETSVYFLPFLGAAASGTKPEATLSERALVFLAGPVPGLAAGLAMMHTLPTGAQLAWWMPLTLMLVYVNLFNLLPVLPLDGGRLVERVLLSPFPRGEVAFKALSAAVFFGLGVRADEALLMLVGGFVALSLPAGIRAARAMQVLELPGPVPRAELYARLDAAGFASMRFVRKFRLVSDLEQRLQAPAAPAWLRLAWFATYLGLLGGAAWAARDLLP
jgi:Zn-dependent protease